MVITDEHKKMLKNKIMASIRRRRPRATFTIESFVILIPENMDEKTGRTAIGHAIETMRKNGTCISIGKKYLVEIGRFHETESTGKRVTRTMYRRIAPSLLEEDQTGASVVTRKQVFASRKKKREKKDAPMEWHKANKKKILDREFKKALREFYKAKDAYEFAKSFLETVAKGWMAYK